MSLERGSSGQFDVVCDGDVIASRARPDAGDLGGFPAAARVIALLRDRLIG